MKISRYTQFFLSFLESFIFYFLLYFIIFVFVFETISNYYGVSVALNSLETRSFSDLPNDISDLFSYEFSIISLGILSLFVFRFLYNLFYYYILNLNILGIPFFNIPILFKDKSSKFKYTLIKSLGIFSVFFDFNKYFIVK